MKIRSLAVVLALTFALTTVAEAKKRPVYSSKAQKARNKATMHKYKVSAHKVSPHKVSPHKVSKLKVKRAA